MHISIDDIFLQFVKVRNAQKFLKVHNSNIHNLIKSTLKSLRIAVYVINLLHKSSEILYDKEKAI